MLATIAQAQPDKIAMRDKFGQTSFRELEITITNLAAGLQALGVGPGVLVGIHAHKSVCTVCAIFAVLRAGGCFIPLSPSNPLQRNEMLLSDTGAQFLLYPPSAEAESGTYLVRDLTNGSQTLLNSDFAAPSPAVVILANETDPAYIFYTSGSTGRPKGVVISHKGARAFLDWSAEFTSLRAEDYVLNVTKFDFDLSIFDIFASMECGARLYVGEDDLSQYPLRLLRLVEEEKITVLYTVPWVLMQLLRCGETIRKSLQSLRTIMFAGEVFPINELRKLMELLPDARFYNLFGPTETNACAAYALPAQLSDDVTEVPIGRPACGAVHFIVDEDGNDVEMGQVGELHVEGPAVLLGYMTEGTFAPSGGRYATGDLVVMRRDGELMYRGRRDTLIKLQGARVELLEIERVIQDHPQVIECAAVIVRGRLSVFIAPRGKVSPLQLRQHASGFLPPYMVPRSIHYMSSLPRNANGKVDRQHLVAQLPPN